MPYRIGIGYDIHRFAGERRLFLGGVQIPYIKGLSGHSDADVLLHAICDALLGAAGQADIGVHFPDTDPKYQDIPSIELLTAVSGLLKKNNFVVSNIDTVIITEEPQISPFKRQMQERIAAVLGIAGDNINIKATTNEGLGEIGRKEGIAAYAVAIITKGAQG